MHTFLGGLSSVLPVCLLLVLCCAGSSSAAPADVPPGPPVVVKADQYEFDPNTGRGVGTGNVRIEYEDVKLRADVVEVNVRTKDVKARGHVFLQRGVFVWRGDRVSGNFERRDFTVGDYAAETGVWYARGKRGEHFPNGRVELDDVALSTCEYLTAPEPHAHYSISARKVIYYPDGRFKAYHTVYRIGRVPVFYVPVMYGDTRSGPNSSIEISPGYGSDWGAYLLLGRRWRIGEDSSTKLMLHLRTKNGVAVGNETRIRTPRSETEFLVYGLHDLDPPETERGYNRRFEVEDNRYRARFYHRQRLTDHLSLRLNLDALSDIDMLEDWFEGEYDRFRQPATFADLTYAGEAVAFSLSARPRVNDFYSAVERLPEARFDVFRRELGTAGLYYQSQTTAGRLRMKWRDFDKDRAPGLADPLDYEAWRLDSLHFLYLPISIRDGTQIIPRAGMRVTYYSRSSDRPLGTEDLNNLFEVDNPDNANSALPIVNYDDAGGSRTRLAGELGVEAAAKFFRVWDSFKKPTWGIDGLRHIVQPYVNYTYAPDPSEDRRHLYFFDETDRLIEQNFVRVGVRQRLQTRRRRRIYDLARMDAYADFHFHRERGYDHAGNLGAKFEIKATEDLKVWGLLLADMGGPALERGELALQMGNPNRLRWTLSYLFRKHFIPRTLYSMGSYLDDLSWSVPVSREFDRAHSLQLALDFPLGEKTSARMEWEYDVVEKELYRQAYRILRDLHCWMGAFEVGSENGDLRVLLMLYLKAFPNVGAHAGI